MFEAVRLSGNEDGNQAAGRRRSRTRAARV
jgi:hypothetical protein